MTVRRRPPPPVSPDGQCLYGLLRAAGWPPWSSLPAEVRERWEEVAARHVATYAALVAEESVG